MEASQTLQNAGPDDLTKLSLELAAHMIHLGKKAGIARRGAPDRAKSAWWTAPRTASSSRW